MKFCTETTGEFNSTGNTVSKDWKKTQQRINTDGDTVADQVILYNGQTCFKI